MIFINIFFKKKISFYYIIYLIKFPFILNYYLKAFSALNFLHISISSILSPFSLNSIFEYYNKSIKLLRIIEVYDKNYK